MAKRYQGPKGTSKCIIQALYPTPDTFRDLCRYFGRAKELPGVKELFESKKKDEDEDVATAAFYKKFTGQGPSYFGDLDEADGELLAFERKAEEEGVHSIPKHSTCTYSLM